MGKRFDFARADWGKCGVEKEKGFVYISSKSSLDEFNDFASNYR